MTRIRVFEGASVPKEEGNFQLHFTTCRINVGIAAGVQIIGSGGSRARGTAGSIYFSRKEPGG